MTLELPGNEELRILLLVSENEKEQKLINLVQEVGYGEVFIVNTWTGLVESAKTKRFDVVISRTNLKGVNIIESIHHSSFFLEHKIPVIFVLHNNILTSQMTLIGNLMVRFLHEQTISLDLLKYSVGDIYQQNKLDTLKRQNEHRYKKLFEHSFDINIIVNNDFEIVEGNEQFTKQVGKELPYALESLFIFSSTYIRFQELLDSSKDLKNLNVELLLHNEPANCLLDTFKLYDEENDLAGYHLIIKDIDTEYRVQQLANRANNLMTTGKFMRSLAHEIRNPLTNIQLAMEQLREDLMATENSELFFNIMKRSSNRITELLSKLMNAYKSSEVKLKEEDLRDIIKRSIFLAQDRVALKEIKLTTEFNLSPVPVQADFEKMSTAILNLIVNAIEAMDKEEKTIEILIDNNNKGQLCFSIKDNAVGMNQEQLQALFNPFYTGKSRGIGLGLTTTQNIILAHHWEIDVKSEVGQGTTFTITI